MAETIDWPPRQPRRHRGVLAFFVLAAAVLFGGGTTLSYYVDALWFASLGYADVFWTTLNVQAVVFTMFAVVTFVVLYGAFLALKPPRLADFLASGAILVNGQPVRVPVEPVLRVIALAAAALIAVATGAGVTANWSMLALYWYGSAAAAGDGARAAAALTDPVFGRPLSFYLFTLPAYQLVSGWLLTLAIVACGLAVFFAAVTGGARAFARRRAEPESLRGVSIAFAAVLAVLAWRVYLARFDRLFDDHTIFSGVTYTDAHVALTGLLVVSIALVVGAIAALVNAASAPRVRWLGAALAPAAICYVGFAVVGWYVNGFIVKPNELVRERPFIANNIAMTRRAYALDRIEQRSFPADAGIAAIDVQENKETLDNIRLWEWRALQDTLRQIQEIRTYYDFPDIDIDRYTIDGRLRQMMVAVRELNVDKLPESSRNWINEKLIYTHGYGVTMNGVNGFTPEGLPDLVLSNMPVQSTSPDVKVTRPEIYFGELTDTDVYVRTRQKEFNYPQGQENVSTSYQGTGGVALGGFLRRTLIALDRGDIAKLPFSDDVEPGSRILMRRNVRARVEAIAPFLTLDSDPYIVVGADGRLTWMMDAYTTSETYPYARPYQLGRERLNYVRNSVKVTIDAYDGSVTFYVFDPEDPVVAAYRNVFPSLFRDADAMPADLRAHVRYPELLLEVQAAVYGLYHMTDPEVFYNREDLWSVASEVGLGAQREQQQQVIEPNFVLMQLPGEKELEFVEILPFTPSNKNNLIGWIAGRSDRTHYGTAIAYDFPKTRLVDGPLQVEARIDQNAQLSGQLSLWNQQGSHVRRGGLLVIPTGRGVLYAEPIFLQAERSPMPELRLVVLALQDRLAYGSTFESALEGLLGEGAAQRPSAAASLPTPSGMPAQTATIQTPEEVRALIGGAAQDLADYQRLTSEGKLGDAGRKLEELKQKLDQLQRARR